MPEHYSLASIGRTFDPLSEYLRQVQSQVENLGSSMDEARRRITQNSTQIGAVIETLEQGMNNLAAQVGRCADSMSRYTSASAQGRQATIQETQKVEDLYDVYKKLDIELSTLQGAQNSLQASVKEVSKVQQLYNEYLRTQEGSYDRLSAKYRIIKILYDNMSRAELDANPKIATSLRDIYQQMNLLQQATGKYQLQVGDYSKAMTGLNIATNQVVRELPVLANGVSMFAIAISNNIPIFADQLVAVNKQAVAQRKLRDEHLRAAEAAKIAGDMEQYLASKTDAASIKVISTVKALLANLLSWQTALVLVLTVLPGFIKKLQEKKKATEEMNGETKEQITLLGLLQNAMSDVKKEVASETTEIVTLTHIINDQNRSLDDRIDAGKRLKQIYDEELANLSAEEIALGKAKVKIDEITLSIEKQARARAILNKITEAYTKQIDRENDALTIGATKVEEFGFGTISNLYEYVQTKMEQTGWTEEYLKKQIAFLTKGDKDVWQRYAQYKSAMEDMKKYSQEIIELEKRLNVSGLLEEESGGGGRGGRKSAALKIADYYNDAMQSLIDGMEDSLEKRLAILDLGWKREQETYEKHRMELLRIQREGNAAERQEATTQLENLHFALLTLEGNYLNERQRMIQETVDSYREAVEDEGDVVAAEQKVIATGLKAEQRLREMAAYEIYEMSDRTAADKEALDAAIRDSERQYWEDYLAGLREAGILTIEEYNTIMANLAKAVKQNEDRMGRGRKGRRYGGIVEALLAQTSTYGEKDKFKRNVIKEEYQDFVSAIDNALKTSMGFMDDWMDKRLEMAKIAVEAAEKEVQAAQKVLDFEMEARANGYANRVETARKELDLEREQHRKALEEQRRLQNEQLLLDSISQASSLVTATANIWEAMTWGTGLLGPSLAIAATALLWGSYAASKVKAAQLAKMQSEQYGEGTVELLEGGSHASGHDIDLGVKKDGTRRRAEGGEFFAVINRRNSRKYRNVIPDVINSFNDGTFGDKYYNANAAMGNFALGLLAGGSPTDVSKLEKDVRAIREQGDEHRYIDSMGNTIIRYKNLTRKIQK